MKYVSMGYFPEGDRNGEEIWYQPGTKCDFDDRTAKKLEKKGWLTHRKAGRAYVYRPVRSRHQVHGRLLRDFLHSAFGGDPRRLLASLLDETPIRDEELDELRKLIEDRKKGDSQ